MSFGAAETYHYLPFANGVATIVPRCFPSALVGAEKYRAGYTAGRPVSFAVLWHSDASLNMTSAFPRGEEVFTCAYFLERSEVMQWIESQLGALLLPADSALLQMNLKRAQLIPPQPCTPSEPLLTKRLAQAPSPVTIPTASMLSAFRKMPAALTMQS